MIKDLVPSVHFYDQDFVDMYDRSWVWIDELWSQGTKENGIQGGYLSYPGQTAINQFESCLASLFLVYSNQHLSPFHMLDFFYSKQEESGAIRSDYSLTDGEPVFAPDNPEGVSPPLFAYVEHGFYHKIGNKKRLKEIVPTLEAYFDWLRETFQRENGLYSVPPAACMLGNTPREQVYYPVDFNAQLAVGALYLSAIGDILNDKELSFRYKRLYFSLKTRINSMMLSPEDGFYYDLDVKESQIIRKHIGSYWTLLAEIPNEERAEAMIEKLTDPKFFGTDNPFPTLAANDEAFCDGECGLKGSVVPFNTYMVVKGLERYGKFEYARECAIRHLYFILDTAHPDTDQPGDVWEAYQPNKEGNAKDKENPDFPRRRLMHSVGLITITLMIEDIIGLEISLPRKTVDWTMTTLEAMGIERLSLKRNLITILSNKQPRGWEIRLESEKLYYFTIKVLEENKKKTLPIPSGKCSMLIDKL